jgi:hypothetical protein
MDQNPSADRPRWPSTTVLAVDPKSITAAKGFAEIPRKISTHAASKHIFTANKNLPAFEAYYSATYGQVRF